MLFAINSVKVMITILKRFFLFIVLFLFQALHAGNEYIIIKDRPGAGMFSMFTDVLSLIYGYEKGYYTGIEVDFGDEGLYYDQSMGRNWWEYYCEPIKIGWGEKHSVRGWFPGIPGCLDAVIDRHEANSLIKKYIKFKSEITDFVEEFVKENFDDNFIVSVHYRGTDKLRSEAKFISYRSFDAVMQNSVRLPGYAKFFIATDDQKFLTYMILKYGKERICYNMSAHRSTNGRPIHIGNLSPYKHGFEALVDALLLSKGDVLVRTSSHLSRWSGLFNPDMPIFQVN